MEQKDRLPDAEELNLIRDFCVRGLAESVPEYMTEEQAADIACYWFPGDTFALEALYRRISANAQHKTSKKSN